MSIATCCFFRKSEIGFGQLVTVHISLTRKPFYYQNNHRRWYKNV